MRKIKVGLIGFGTIGSGVAQVLIEKRAALRNKTGIDIELKYICDKDLTSDRGFKVNKNLLTTDLDQVLNDPAIDIVIELIGGIHPAKDIILKAFKNKKHVITANKALLAENAVELLDAARINNCQLRFEASVGGGIPIIKAIREGFISNRIDEIYGIINGTTNYILSRMSDEGCSFDVALKSAREMGVAEANPKLDISGMDSAHKLIILSALSFGLLARVGQVYCEGIAGLEPRDIKYARGMGYTIKLLAIAKKSDSMVEMRVHPTLVPNTHLLANVKDVYNAIYVKGDLTGETLFYGKGAGKFPTASAVVADVVDLAKLINKADDAGISAPAFILSRGLKIKKMNEIKSRYYLRFSTLDEPGVLARIAGILGKNMISISSVEQKEGRIEKAVPIVIMTHLALEKNLRNALKVIDGLPVVKKKTAVIRVESLV